MGDEEAWCTRDEKEELECDSSGRSSTSRFDSVNPLVGHAVDFQVSPERLIEEASTGMGDGEEEDADENNRKERKREREII